MRVSLLVSVFAGVHLSVFVLCVSEHVIVGVSVCFCVFVSVCVIVSEHVIFLCQFL